MTPTNELVILKPKQRVRRVEELGMENNLDAVVHAVEQIAAADTSRERNWKDNKLMAELCNHACELYQFISVVNDTTHGDTVYEWNPWQGHSRW